MLSSRHYGRAVTVATFALACLTAPALAQTDFSGIWRLRQPPDSGNESVVTIEQRGTSLKMVTRFSSTGPIGAAGTFDHTYTIGGDPEVRRTDDGIVRTVAVTWEGETLVFLRTEREGANTTSTREVWALSSDRLTLTRKRHTTTWRGESDDQSVFDRQRQE